MDKEKESWGSKIVPFEKSDFKDNEIYINEVSISYYQNNDCTESEEEVQKMVVSCRNNGMARFVNIKTDENGWSIDSVDNIKLIVDDFCRRAEIDLNDDASA